MWTLKLADAAKDRGRPDIVVLQLMGSEVKERVTANITTRSGFCSIDVRWQYQVIVCRIIREKLWTRVVSQERFRALIYFTHTFSHYTLVNY